jgi:hypothetical protein
MKTFLTILAIIIGSIAISQGQFTFSTNGSYAKFFIDGNVQNNSNKTFLKVLNVPEGQHEVKIRFSNGTESSMSMYFLSFKDYAFGVKNVYGHKKLILNGMGNAIAMNPNGNNVVNFSTNQWNTNQTLNANCTCGNCYGSSFSCGGSGFNVTIDGGHNQQSCVCSNGHVNTGCSIHGNQNNSHTNHSNHSGHSNHGKHPQMLEYSGTVGSYKNRISRTELINVITKEAFADAQVSAAKMALKHNSVSVDDLMAALKKIAFDDQKLNLAKFAYDHTIDIGNFYKVGSAFTFSSNKQELNQFIQKK